MRVTGCRWCLPDSIRIDGWPTVFAITGAGAGQYVHITRDVQVKSGFSWTGTSPEHLSGAEVQVSGASPSIKDNEVAAPAQTEVVGIIGPRGIDVLTVMVSTYSGVADLASPGPRAKRRFTSSYVDGKAPAG